jgi:hypothetical protein
MRLSCPLEHFGVRTHFSDDLAESGLTFRGAGKERVTGRHCCPFPVGLAESQPFRHLRGPILRRVADSFPFVLFRTDRVSSHQSWRFSGSTTCDAGHDAATFQIVLSGIRTSPERAAPQHRSAPMMPWM